MLPASQSTNASLHDDRNHDSSSAVTIRAAQVEDAEAFLQLRKQLADETPFLLRSSDEITLSIEEQRKQIQAALVHDEHLILLAEGDGRLLGFLMGIRGMPKRTRHVLTLVIGVCQSCVREGIGTLLFSQMQTWAIKHSIHRLELHVVATNQGAIAFYHTQGFHCEGIRKHAQYINGHYVDEYLLARMSQSLIV